MSLDPNVLSATMIDAVRAAMAHRWPSVEAVAEPELRRLACALGDTERLLRSGTVDRGRAQTLVYIYQFTARSVLRTAGGLGLLTADMATRAAIDSVSAAINGAAGFKLL